MQEAQEIALRYKLRPMLATLALCDHFSYEVRRWMLVVGSTGVLWKLQVLVDILRSSLCSSSMVLKWRQSTIQEEFPLKRVKLAQSQISKAWMTGRYRLDFLPILHPYRPLR
jgi:hypothetical protein